ncbi:Plastin-3 [Clonorchis sinensis]|uniref:Plastin-3 n=3 Tax=Clonorchis sinensis TaxID=79923 RepID=A0A8T1MN12_CLOSI|nr:Plastin-3 [Clonorchis sinensis]
MDGKRGRQPAKLSQLLETFYAFDPKYTGHLRKSDILPALQHLGCRVNEGEVYDALQAAEIVGDTEELTLNDFKRIYQEVCKHDPRRSTIENVAPKATLHQYGAAGGNVEDDTLHSVSEEEQIAFSSWIERNLKDDKECASYFPFDSEGGDLYEKCSDGVLLCKIINCSVPGTIDPRALNKSEHPTTFQMHENITLALNSARAIGCNVVNIGAGDILNGTKHLLLGLLWQVIKIGLLKQINVVAHAELATLLEGDETISEFAKLSPEDILIRWVNYHLKGTESDARMHNFTADIRNCEVYAYLVEKIAPQEKKPFMHSTKAILDAVDLVQRAEMVLQNAEKLDCRVFVRPEDIVSGSQRLNLAFLANLFHGYPALEKPTEVEEKVAEIEETREEKTYRNWINSMGLTKTVNHLYSDLKDGITLLKLFDLVKKNSVDWSHVHTELCQAPAKANFQRLENCNEVIKLGREAGFSLVGLGGDDIYEGKKTMILALLWQLMRAYTLSLLTRLTRSRPKVITTNLKGNENSPITETEIIDWANERLRLSGKTTRISREMGFTDPNLASGMSIIDLIDAIRPGSVNYNVVMPGRTKADQLANAKYAIPLARRIGAAVFAVPEDIVEMKAKMIMTIFACLMIADMESSGRRLTGDQPQSSKAFDLHTISSSRPEGSYESTVIGSYIYSSAKSENDTTLDIDSIHSSQPNDANSHSFPTENSRSPPDKVYVKTYSVTVLNYSNKPYGGNSKLFTKMGGAGDCVDTTVTSQTQEKWSKDYDRVGEIRSRPRFLSPPGTRSRPSARSPADFDRRTQWEFVENLKSTRNNNLSRSIPSINISDDEGITDTYDPKPGVQRCNLIEVPVTRSTRAKENDSRLGYCVKFNIPEESRKTHFETPGGYCKLTETSEEQVSIWRQETHAHRSHGGGRLFMATKCKK